MLTKSPYWYFQCDCIEYLTLFYMITSFLIPMHYIVIYIHTALAIVLSIHTIHTSFIKRNENENNKGQMLSGLIHLDALDYMTVSDEMNTNQINCKGYKTYLEIRGRNEIQ